MSAVPTGPGDGKLQEEHKKTQTIQEQTNLSPQNNTKEVPRIKIDRSEYCYFACGNRSFHPVRGYVKSTLENDAFFHNRIMPDEFCKLDSKQQQEHIEKCQLQFNKLEAQLNNCIPNPECLTLLKHMTIELRLKSTLHRFLAGDDAALKDIQDLQLQAQKSKQQHYWPGAVNKEFEAVIATRKLGADHVTEGNGHEMAMRSKSTGRAQSSKHGALPHKPSGRVPKEYRYQFEHRPQPLILSKSAGTGASVTVGVGVSAGAAGTTSVGAGRTSVRKASSSAGAIKKPVSRSSRFPLIRPKSPKTPLKHQDSVSSLSRSQPRSQSTTALSQMAKDPVSPATDEVAASSVGLRSGALGRNGHNSRGEEF